MTEDDFRLPRSSYETLRRIIKAYGHVDGPAGPGDVADLIGVHRTQVSRNNKFLVSAGIVESGQKKQTTSLGANLARALEFEKPADIKRYWHELLEGHDFIEKIRTAVKVRGGMERSDLESHIAYTAGQKKSKGVMTGAGALVDLLIEGGLLEEHDGQMVVPSGEGPEWPEEEEPEKSPPHTLESERTVRAHHMSVDAGGIPATLAIELQIRCSPDELEGLAPQLHDFLEELSQAVGETDDGNGE